MPSLMVCALLGLAVAVLLDVAGAPGPGAPLIETPVMIVGLERFRRLAAMPRPPRRPRATPTYFLELPDVSGEIDIGAAAADASGATAAEPSVIVEL